MWSRLVTAVQDGIILGVKWAIVIALALFGLGYAIGDYSIVRQRALNGQAAFEFLQRAQTQGAADVRPVNPTPQP